MKLSFKKILPMICAIGLFCACGLTVAAGDLPQIKAKSNEVSVTHDDSSETVKFNVSNWESSTPFAVKYAVDDASIAKVELSSQNSDSFKLKIKAKGTGTTVVKVWLDGYSRNCEYIIVDSIYYQRDDEDEYCVKHYGYMTGTKGEAAIIDDYSIENVNGEERLYVYFTLKDKGIGSLGEVTFTAKCEESDGDKIGTVKAVASGMVEGGSGYKIYFKLPKGTADIKLVNDDL